MHKYFGRGRKVCLWLKKKARESHFELLWLSFLLPHVADLLLVIPFVALLDNFISFSFKYFISEKFTSGYYHIFALHTQLLL
jgi:hypothetical protein